MADTKTLIEQAYSAFNKRDIDGAFSADDARRELAQGFGGRQKLSERKRSAPIGLDNGASLIPMSNR